MTVFELTVVLLIGLILVGLGWIMTRPAVTRTKISRVQEDHRALARAISNYQIDYSDRPNRLAELRAPANYLAGMPRDPFQQSGGYVYVPSQSPEMPALLISTGPDGDFDIPPEILRMADSSLAQANLLPNWDQPSFNQSGIEGESSPEVEFAAISTYLYLGMYNPERGNDGDIITIVH